MKKILFILIFLFSINVSYANTTLNYSPTTSSSFTDNCPSENDLDGNTKYGIPLSNGPGSITSSTTTCSTYYYYDKGTYTVSYSQGTNTTCNSGDRVIGRTGGASGTITCRRGYTTIQNSDTISDDLADLGGTNSRLKIYGNIGTTGKTTKLTSDQGGNIMLVQGGFYKSSLKKDIKSNAFKYIKNVNNVRGSPYDKVFDLSNFSSTNNLGGTIIGDKKNIRLYKNSGKILEIGSSSSTIVVSGKKTLLLYGQDIYISKDMYYNNKNTDILGVIVLKDSKGKGGNIYIDPKVTNIVGTYFTENSIFTAKVDNLSSTQDITYYSGTDRVDYLKNQLYIFGSLFSENTVGGSISTPVKCPYYITNTCTKSEARKYDLNFIRNYYLVTEYNSSLTTRIIPYNNGKMIGGGICDIETGICNGFTPNLDHFITPGSLVTLATANAGYSLIIKYNSNLQINPPPLFSSN